MFLEAVPRETLKFEGDKIQTLVNWFPEGPVIK